MDFLKNVEGVLSMDYPASTDIYPNKIQSSDLAPYITINTTSTQINILNVSSAGSSIYKITVNQM